MGNAEDRREHLRKLLSTQARIAELDTDRWTSMRLFDVSKTGIGFIHPQPLALNRLYSIEFHLPDSAAVIACVVILLHRVELKDKPGYRVGARFVWITEDDAERVTDYVWEQAHPDRKIDWS